MRVRLHPSLQTCVSARQSGELQKCLHGHERCHGAGILDRSGQHETEVRVEVLLIVGGQAQAPEASAFGVALGLVHQNPSVSFPALSLGHNHRLNEQAAAVTYDSGDPNVAEQPLRLFVALQENQGDGELGTRLLEEVESGSLASLPLRVDQVGTRSQQVWTPVDWNAADLPWLLRICV